MAMVPPVETMIRRGRCEEASTSRCGTIGSLSIISVRKKTPATPVLRRQDGKKHHVLVDTQALPRPAIVYAAAIQDRDGGVPPMRTLFGLAPFLRKLPTAAQKEGGSSRD
jgi:hypothetical protein